MYDALGPACHMGQMEPLRLFEKDHVQAYKKQTSSDLLYGTDAKDPLVIPCRIQSLPSYL
jgi:hypothetical protein